MARSRAPAPSNVVQGLGDVQSQILDIVQTGEALGWSAGFTYQTVANALPGLPTDDIDSGIALAHSQIEGGAAFGLPGAYTRPRLAQIPVVPGVKAGTIDVRIRVQVSDASGRALFDGVVSCSSQAIPDETDLAVCVDDWMHYMVDTYYAGEPGTTASATVETASRGTYFGR